MEFWTVERIGIGIYLVALWMSLAIMIWGTHKAEERAVKDGSVLEKQEYIHPIKWAIKHIDNREMKWMFVCQLSESGLANLHYFLRHFDLRTQEDWIQAVDEANEKTSNDRRIWEEVEQMERDRRFY